MIGQNLYLFSIFCKQNLFISSLTEQLIKKKTGAKKNERYILVFGR